MTSTNSTHIDTTNLMPIRLGMDLDGVIYNFYKEFCKYAVEFENVNPEIIHTKPSRWDFYADWEVSHEEYLRMIERAVVGGHLFVDGEVSEGSVEALAKIKSMNFEIIIITARKVSQDEEINGLVEMVTQMWLDKNMIPHDELVVINDKTKYNLDILVDDNLHNIHDSALIDRRAIVFDAPWNQGSSYDRVCGWDELVEEMSKIRDMIDAATANEFYSEAQS
jgi:5'(3')-deoxyribonucleotidase